MTKELIEYKVQKQQQQSLIPLGKVSYMDYTAKSAPSQSKTILQEDGCVRPSEPNEKLTKIPNMDHSQRTSIVYK